MGPDVSIDDLCRTISVGFRDGCATAEDLQAAMVALADLRARVDGAEQRSAITNEALGRARFDGRKLERAAVVAWFDAMIEAYKLCDDPYASEVDDIWDDARRKFRELIADGKHIEHALSVGSLAPKDV